MELELFIQMAYALGIGLLVGLERSMVQTGPPPQAAPPAGQNDGGATASAFSGDQTGVPAPADTAGPSVLPDKVSDEGEWLGTRTFAVLSLVGFGAALAGERLPLLGPVALGGLCLLVVAMYLRARELGVGITTEVAAIGVCLLGMLCRTQPHAAGALALLLTVLLASKRFVHDIVRKLRRVELTDTLKFLVVVLILLPLLPDRAVDPYGALNPHKIGFLVVLISGISFVGYFLTRILGPQRGLGITGVLGGLTSSTAVTAAMAAEARQAPHLLAICTFSTVAANATMFARVLVVVAVLDRTLALRLAWPVGAMCATAALASVVLWLSASHGRARASDRSGELVLKNPFSIGPALKFGLFFVGILLAARLARIYLGNQGLFAAAAVSGLADVDAITLTIAEQTRDGSLAHGVGAIGIIIAVISNSVVKSGIAIYSGGWRFGRLVGLCLGLAAASGLLVAIVL